LRVATDAWRVALQATRHGSNRLSPLATIGPELSTRRVA